MKKKKIYSKVTFYVTFVEKKMTQFKERIIEFQLKMVPHRDPMIKHRNIYDEKSD
jgi:hypothetical protein